MTNSHGKPLSFGFRSSASKQATNKLVKAHNEAKLSAYRAYWDNFDADLYSKIVTVKLNNLNR